MLVEDDGQWYLLHHSVMFEELEEPFGTIFDGSKEYRTLTLGFLKEFPLHLIGSPKEDKDRRICVEYTEDTWSISRQASYQVPQFTQEDFVQSSRYQ